MKSKFAYRFEYELSSGLKRFINVVAEKPEDALDMLRRSVGYDVTVNSMTRSKIAFVVEDN